MSKHVLRRRFGRRSRTIVAIAAGAVVFAAPAFAADTIFPDGDTGSNAPNISYVVGGGTNAQDCADRGTPVAGSIRVRYNGSGSQHFSQGESLTVLFSAPAGVTVTPGVIPNVPVTWGASQSDEFFIPFTTTVTNSSAGGKVEVTVTGDSSGYSAGADSIDCGSTTPANVAPSVLITSSATTSDEGSKTDAITFSITDPDSSSWTFANNYPICGTDGISSDTSINNATKTGSFKCTFPDGPATRTVSVKVTDSAGADSNVDTVGATVNNVNPIVATPAFSASSVDCRNQISLTPIRFSDPGLLDADWIVDIDWGDGTAHTHYTTGTQGLKDDETHTYNAPGSYTATVSVTDKDHGTGSASTLNPLVVNHVYNTDFLPPFDDSSPSGLIVNSMKNGRTVPVKATIYDVCAQAYVTSPSVVTIGVKKVSSPTSPPASDAVESYSDAGASSGNTNLFRWNPDSTSSTGGFWIYNLDSKALALVTNSYYRIDIAVDGNQATKTDWAILQPVK